ncbi:hypothetical protein HWV62_30899 [Athelia sp. TMB]|nr:hypothetical protein HWV62_30899 [Athelia sp. TMB]
MFGVMGKPIAQGELPLETRMMSYKNRNQCFVVLRQVEDTRQAEAYQRAMQMGKAPPKQLQASFGVKPDMGPMDVHDLRYMKEADLLPLMVRGRDQVIDLDERSKSMVLHVAWKGYAPRDYTIPHDGRDVRPLTRAALAIEVAKAVYDYIKRNIEVQASRNVGPFRADWDIVTKVRLVEIYNVFKNNWMVQLAMLEEDAQGRVVWK